MKIKAISRLQLTYILSYMFIFFVPFSIMSLIFYHNSVNSLREEIELSNIHSLENIKQLIDGRIKELEKIGALISFDSRLTPYMVSVDTNRHAAIDELKKYKENSSIIDELYLLYHNQDEILSSDGLMSINTFLDYRSSLEDASVDTLKKNLRDIHYPLVSTKFKLFGEHPTYMYPLPPGPVNSYGIVFLKLEETFFIDMINNILGSYEGNVFIFDQNDEVIATYSNNTNLNVSHMIPILNKSKKINELNIDNINYSVLKVTSETSNWSFVTALPTKQFFGKVSEFKTFMLLILSFVAITASIISIYIALRQFHPIEKMLEIVKKKDNSFPFTHKNELDNLRISIENMYAKHEYLNNKFETQEPLIRDQCLIMLLQGQVNAVDRAQQLFDSLHLQFNRPYSFVFVTSLSKDQLSGINMQELELASSQLLKDAKIYSVELINDKVMAFIINGKSNNMKEKEEFLNLIHQLLLSYETSAIIGVGETYKGKEHINRSFIEASAAYEYGKANEINGVTQFMDIQESQETQWLPKDLLLKLTQSYKQGNANIAKEAIKSLMNWLIDKNPSVYLVKHMQYDIINTVIKTISEMDIRFKPEKIYYLTDTTSIDEFINGLSAFTDHICIKISQSKEKQKNELQIEILKYIAENFKEYDLSLENMAQKFNLSASYLSRFIKEETKITFSQYVWELRLEEVKNQLIRKDIPIKEIITKVGYIDAPNFTRKFKNAVGLTPGQYRNLYTKKAE